MSAVDTGEEKQCQRLAAGTDCEKRRGGESNRAGLSKAKETRGEKSERAGSSKARETRGEDG